MTTDLRRMLQLRGTTAEWAANDTFVPLAGEVCIEVVTGTPLVKVGDGTSTWAELSYVGGVDQVARDAAADNATDIAAIEGTLSTNQPAIDSIADLTDAVEALQAASGGNAPYDLHFDWGLAELDADAEKAFHLTRSITFDADFTESGGQVIDDPTALVEFDVLKNAVLIATVEISTSGVVTTTSETPGVQVAAAPDDLITMRLTSSPDATLTGFRYTLGARLGF